MKNIRKRGFTLIEMLTYISILIIATLAISSFLIWMIRFNINMKTLRETQHYTERAMRIMNNEIKFSTMIIDDNSNFNNHPGKISIKSSDGSITDFFLYDGLLYIEKELDKTPLFPDYITITNLIFRKITNKERDSIQIEMTAEHKGPINRPEYQSVINMRSTTSLRIY